MCESVICVCACAQIMGSSMSAVDQGLPKSVGELQAAAFGPTGKVAFADMKGNEGRIQVRICVSIFMCVCLCVCVCVCVCVCGHVSGRKRFIRLHAFSTIKWSSIRVVGGFKQKGLLVDERRLQESLYWT